jgi:hypothetical protein
MLWVLFTGFLNLSTPSLVMYERAEWHRFKKDRRCPFLGLKSAKGT